MSQPNVIYWPSTIANATTIAPLQIVGADLTVKIASNLPYPQHTSDNTSGIYVYDKMIRNVSLTSASDLSAVNFSITGLSSPIDATGNPTLSIMEMHTEVIAGPNTNTVYTARIYSQITSITTNAPTGADLVSVGFGERGITAYVFLSSGSSSPQHFSFQGQPINATANFDYEFFSSVTRPETIDYNYGKLTPFPAPIPAFSMMQGAGIQHNTNFVMNNLGGLPCAPCSILWAMINDREAYEAAPIPDASFYFTVLQQGIGI